LGENPTLESTVTCQYDSIDFFEESERKNLFSQNLQSRKALHSPNDFFQIHIVSRGEGEKTNRYVLVVLFRRSFLQGNFMIGCCSLCHQSRLHLQVFEPGLCKNTTWTEEMGVQTCSHLITATKNAFHDLDLQISSEPSSTLAEKCTKKTQKKNGWFEALKLEGVKHNFWVHISNTNLLSLFIRKKHAWKCHLCASYKCSHWTAISNWPETIDDDSNTEGNLPNENYYQPLLYSVKRYSFIDPEMWSKAKQRSMRFLSFIEETFEFDGSYFIIRPENVTCACGQSLKFSQKAKHCMIVGPSFISNVKILSGKCLNVFCKDVPPIRYDGYNDLLINLKDKFLFCAEELLQYLELYARDGTAVNSWWESKIALHVATIADPLERAIQQSWLGEMRSHVATAITGFAELLDFPYDLIGCCQKPSKITVDGIVLSIKQLRIPSFKTPWITDKIHYRASTRPERSLSKISADEKNLFDLLLTQTQLSRKILLIGASSQNSGLALICQILLDQSPCNQVACPKPLQIFLMCFEKTLNPAVSLIPFFLAPVLENLLLFPKELSPDDSKALNLYAPVLMSVLNEAKKCGSRSKTVLKFQCFISNLKSLLSKSMHASIELREKITQFPDIIPSEHLFASKNLATTWMTGQYFPCYEPIYSIPSVDIGAESIEKRCTKNYKEKGACGAGILPFWCLEHKKCLGWVILESAESPKTISEILITRFPQAQIVMYDNSCKLHDYMLNRFPNACTDMVFMIDKLHIKNHDNCAPTYSAFAYDSLLCGISTVLAEQRNSTLARLKRTAPHMTFRMFVALLRFATAKGNRDQNHRQIIASKR
jgi:CxC4 like cysteine cluster associated with KDZ transposases